MRPALRFIGGALGLAAFLALAMTSCFAAATLTQQIDPAEINAGDQTTVNITVQNGSVSDLHLPPVDGLDVVGTSSTMNFSITNGSVSKGVSFGFAVTASRAGDFTIPAFDIRTEEGDVLHVKAMKLHVLAGGASPPAANGATAVPSTAPSQNPFINLPFNPNGPVVMPPANAPPAPAPPANENPAGTANADDGIPRDKDGGPAKVFIIITPQTTDAYVGQSVPLEIDFYIRMEVNADQDSLPTIKGIDFLMNSFTHRGHESLLMVEGHQYECESWRTAISAPKAGDFPLSMERDTYWVKSIASNPLDPFGGFFSRHQNLAHESISSNQLIMHIHDLPAEGRPAHFTGAIGQFKVTGEAQPDSVAVGDPVELHFTVSGEGNFDYVRCPALPGDPAWRTYVPSSKTDYLDESHTRAVKTFEQSVIPQTNGNVQLPAASFSYFDPSTKQYVTVPIALPEITVTGSPVPVASTGPADANATAPSPPKAAEFLPNLADMGSPQMSLVPAYRRSWFWAVQGGMAGLLLLGALCLFIRSCAAPDNDRAERALRQRTRQKEEDAMAAAASRGDALAFFVAARHAIQLQLGAQWNLRPEALTLGEIRERDPHLAETLEPLFTQADEVIYSGQAGSGLDLAQWEHRVREMLQLQPA